MQRCGFLLTQYEDKQPRDWGNQSWFRIWVSLVCGSEVTLPLWASASRSVWWHIVHLTAATLVDGRTKGWSPYRLTAQPDGGNANAPSLLDQVGEVLARQCFSQIFDLHICKELQEFKSSQYKWMMFKKTEMLIILIWLSFTVYVPTLLVVLVNQNSKKQWYHLFARLVQSWGFLSTSELHPWPVWKIVEQRTWPKEESCWKITELFHTSSSSIF